MESAGAELVTVPADIEDFQIDFAAFDQALTPNTKGVIINSPNNPTGVVYSEATIQKLAQVLTEKSKEYGHTIWAHLRRAIPGDHLPGYPPALGAQLLSQHPGLLFVQ